MMQVASHFFRNLTAQQKLYFRIFLYLTILTGLEVGFLYLPIPHLYVTLLVCTASIAKAVLVGWFYMHLNHETKGLKIILLFPLFVAFFYAIFLIWDSHVDDHRHASAYVGQPKRFFGQRKIADRKVDDFGNTVVDEAPESHHVIGGDSASAASVSSPGGTADSGKIPEQAGTVDAKLTTTPGDPVQGGEQKADDKKQEPAKASH